MLSWQPSSGSDFQRFERNTAAETGGAGGREQRERTGGPVESSNFTPTPPYAKGLAYLLIVVGAALIASSVAVLYGSFAFPDVEAGNSSISRFAIGAGGFIASGLTLALGVLTLVAAKSPARWKAAHTVAVAAIVASVLALLCCNAIGGGLPTSLVLNLLLAIIWAAAMRTTRG